MKKKDVLPVVIASVIALVITVVARFLVPGNSSSNKSDSGRSGHEISMPNIPLMVKETQKVEEVDVLVVSSLIDRGEKILVGKLSWKKWPKDIMQSDYIAKNAKGEPLNNGGDYKLALTMWAKTDIPAGTPLTISMLSNEDILKKEKEEKEKKAAEAKKKEQEKKKKENTLLREGMRAITFPIDQKSTVSRSMIHPGDVVDVLIMEQRGERVKTHKYKALTVLALDGETKADMQTAQKQDASLLGGTLNSLGGMLTPKNVTLEVKEQLVDIMLRQVGSGGVILSVRNQSEHVESGVEEIDGEVKDDKVTNAFVSSLASMKKSSAADALMDAQQQKEKDDRNMSILLNTMARVGSTSKNVVASGTAEAASTPVVTMQKSEKSGKYEVVSGRIVGDDDDELKAAKKEDKAVVIYRKLTPKSVELDEMGRRKMATDGAAGLGGMSSGSYSGSSM